MKKLSLIILLLFPFFTQAEVVEFPEEDLAQESVLPIFDKVEVVKSRKVPTKERFEFGGGFGLNLTEALYDNKSFNINGAYNFSNIHAVNLIGVFAFDGLSSMGEDLANAKGLAGGGFDPRLAPSPKTYLTVNYQITAYYGKISLSKDFVMNLALYGMAGLANVQFDDSSSFGLTAGIGQKFYFNENFGLRFDLLGMTYQGPDPTSVEPLRAPNVTEQLPSSAFKEITYFRTFFNFGLVYLL